MPKKFDFEVPKSLTEIVAARVRQAIIEGEFQLGQNISEELLAESFGVSRTPVRDALTLLQSTGLVEIRPKRGSFVFMPTEQDILAVCDFRVTLELHAAKLSLALDRKATLDSLDTIVEEMAAADTVDDAPRYGRADAAFHEALFVNCGNPYVRDAYGLLSGKVASMRTNLSKQFSNAREVSINEHREIVRLLRDGDLDGLERLLRLHVGRTVDAFRLAAQSGQFAPPRLARLVRP